MSELTETSENEMDSAELPSSALEIVTSGDHTDFSDVKKCRHYRFRSTQTFVKLFSFGDSFHEVRSISLP